MDEFDFSGLEEVKIPITAPDGRKFILREVFGDGYDAWQNAITDARQYNADGKMSGFKNLAETDNVLIAKSLVEILPDGTMQAVGPEVPSNWPQKMRAKVLAKLREVSELDEIDTEEELIKQIEKLQARLAKVRAGKADQAKNVQSNSEDGSSSPSSSK